MTLQVAYAVVNREQHILSTREIDSLMARLLNEKPQSIDTVKAIEDGKSSSGRGNESSVVFEHLQSESLMPTKTKRVLKPFSHLTAN